MTEQSSHNIEDLFERMGAIQVLEDTEHRYALRRKILCSKHFQNTAAQERKRFFLLIAPFFASGFIVIALTVSPTAALQKDMVVPETPAMLSQTEQVADEAVIPSFLTDGLSAQYIDDRPMIPMGRDSNRVVMNMANALYAQ